MGKLPQPLAKAPGFGGPVAVFESAQAKQQKIMQVAMPLFIGWISLSFPSGLIIYWVVSNLFQWAQQWVMYRKKGAKA